MTTALITGGNRGIGQAAAQALAEQGIDVIIGSRDPELGAATATEIGHGATAIALDVTDATSIREAAEWVHKHAGRLDILVNNAGVLPEATHDSREIVSLDMFRQTFHTNLFGPVAMIEAFLPHLRLSAAGRIVNVSTTMGSLTDQTDPNSPYYSLLVPAYQCSKAALNNLTIAVAKGLADTTIKVTSVCPGFVQTDLTPTNREQAPLTAADAARIIVTAATLPDDAPSGTFIDNNGPIAW